MSFPKYIKKDNKPKEKCLILEQIDLTHLFKDKCLSISDLKDILIDIEKQIKDAYTDEHKKPYIYFEVDETSDSCCGRESYYESCNKEFELNVLLSFHRIETEEEFNKRLQKYEKDLASAQTQKERKKQKEIERKAKLEQDEKEQLKKLLDKYGKDI